MCRWMAYKGKSIYLEDWLLNSDHSLIEQSRAADMMNFGVNGDGFGIGWYGKKPQPGLFKSITPAWNNSNLQSLAEHVSSPLFLAHVRAATGTPIQETNSHPFQYKNWLMVHNGLIHDYEVVKKSLISLIDAKYFRHILGSTDSEVLFYILLSNGLQDDIHAAVKKTIESVEAIAKEHQLECAFRMTLGISDGSSIWAVRYSSNSQSSTLFYALDNESQSEHLLVVSEPLDDCLKNWIPVEENTILQFDEKNTMSLTTIS